MTDQPDAGRRGFLRIPVVLAPAAVLAAGVARAQDKPARNDLLEAAPAPATPAEPDYKPGYFTPAEWALLNAACDRLIPKDETGPGAVELGVPQYIDRQMQTPYGTASGWYMSGPFPKAAPEFGYQSPLTPRQQYRLSLRAIDAACRAAHGKVFAALAAGEQDAVLKQVEAGTLKDDTVDLAEFFKTFLLANVHEGYFGDPMYGGNKDMGAWKMIGYPGVRGDYVDWVDQYGRQYPYGPVSLHGQE